MKRRSGSGYIIIDPQAGSGAYFIDGGANGGVTLSSDNNVTNNGWYYFIGGIIIGIANVSLPILVGLGVIGGLTGGILFVGVIISNYILSKTSQNNYDAFNNGQLVGVLATLATTILMFGLVPLQALFWAGFLFLIIANLIIFGRNLLEWLSLNNFYYFYLLKREEVMYA